MHDVVVIGAGPAGASAARLLASWGYSVALLVGLRPRRPPGAESLPPSIRKPLMALGLGSVVEGAGFIESTGNTAAWAGASPTAVPFERGEIGYQVRRDRLDSVLRRAAAEAGVALISATARSVVFKERIGNAWSEVGWSGPDGEGVARGVWILDASGRAGVIARQGLRVRQPGPATLAISATWDAERWDTPDPSHTHVESYLEGWAWSVPISKQRRHVAVMVDPRARGGDRGSDLERAYRAELEKLPHHKRLLGGARRSSAPWACTATPYYARRYDGNGYLLVGDAGSFIDPLSSFGVKKAFASAWLASVVVNTALRNAAMEAPARALYSDRERAASSEYSRLAADFYAEAARHHSHPYWTSRAESSVQNGETKATPAADSDRLLRDPRVLAALDNLRRQDRIRLRLGSHVSRELRPTVQGKEVVHVEHLVASNIPEGIASVRGIHLPHLVDLLSEHDEIPGLYEAWIRERAPVDLANFVGALSLLLAYGLVRPVT